MPSRYRLLVVALVAATAAEIVLESTLVFLNLTGQPVPSLTVTAVDALGRTLEVGTPRYRYVTVGLGGIGVLLLSGAVWQLLEH